VAHCVSGFVCATPDEMADAVADVAYLRRETVREWVSAHHSMRVMIDGMERLLSRAADGETW
jgi:hypothetical protein